jgi:hypothetical protein
MLAGLRDTGQSMFSKLGVNSPMEPNIEDMEAAAEAVRFNKTITYKSYNVKTFDTAKTKDRNAYAKLMMELQKGVQANTHVVWYQDRRFVEPKDTTSTGTWLVHIEWGEFELKVEPVAPIGMTDTGDTNA